MLRVEDTDGARPCPRPRGVSHHNIVEGDLSPPAPAPPRVCGVCGPSDHADGDLGPVTLGNKVELVQFNENLSRGVSREQTLESGLMISLWRLIVSLLT